jgi:hypothetical protein
MLALETALANIGNHLDSMTSVLVLVLVLSPFTTPPDLTLRYNLRLQESSWQKQQHEVALF